MIQEDLKQRFPDTEFTFIDAGIPSTGSTPHAFRFENDVLQKGVPDLLFVEAAVNDSTIFSKYAVWKVLSAMHALSVPRWI